MNREEKRRRILTLLALTSATAMLFLDTNILPVALPTIQKDLGATSLQLQWVINIYTLVAAVLMLAMGRLSDIFGHRNFFNYGLLIFAISSAIGGLAQSPVYLIISRGLQGVGCAMIAPTSMALIVDNIPVRLRGKMVGLMVAIASIFLSLGPIIGGAFTQYLTWRLAFWINLPISFVGVYLVLKVIPPSKRQAQKIDYPAFAILVAGFSLFTYAIMQARDYGWKSPLILSLLFAGILCLCLLYFIEKRSDCPFLDFKLFKNRLYGVSIVQIFLVQGITMLTVFWPLLFQYTFKFTPYEAGYVVAIATLPLLIFSPLAGFLNDRFGPRIPVAIGWLLTTFGLLWFRALELTARIPDLVPGLLAFGAGLAMVYSPSGTTAASIVSDKQRGIAMGMYNTVRYTAATLGVAIFGAIIASLRTHYIEKLRPVTQTAYELHNRAALATFSVVELWAAFISVFAFLITILFYKGRVSN
ncbi:MAG: MFS transporter [Simkaniaceae bacterium]|nr:MFS transporter [Simkaniaceae bacterium]